MLTDELFSNDLTWRGICLYGRNIADEFKNSWSKIVVTFSDEPLGVIFGAGFLTFGSRTCHCYVN